MTIDREPEECVFARVTAQGDGRFVVRLERADGEPVPPILCGSVAQAASLVREMNPANADALLAELDDNPQAFMARFVEAFANGLH
jgi:hypothetical protein